MQATRPLSASRMSPAAPSLEANSASICGERETARARPSPLGRSANWRAKLPKVLNASGVAGPMDSTPPPGQKTASISSSTVALVSTRHEGSTCSANTRASCRAATCTCSPSRRLWLIRWTTWRTRPGFPMPLARCSIERTFTRILAGTLALVSTRSGPEVAGSMPGGELVKAALVSRPNRSRSPDRSSSGSRRLQLLSAMFATAS
mmetsp:Transcript_323/g.818  ORF Transcript_323/g.818 Transcript_323/m.818 type:complete len:206 (-) Transcript_323:799-1416(-)